jgi:CMP-N-acetylneuraminic acid synthetase
MKYPSVKALVPMKDHSERVPGKNMRVLAGRPCFHWIVDALLCSKYIDEVIINTDSEAIAKNATDHFKVTILNRPEHLCGDMVSMAPLTEYDLSQTNGTHYLQTHCTNPLLTTDTINMAIKCYFDMEEYDSLFTVTEVKSRYYWPDGKAVNHDPDNLIRTQDLSPIYEENSCIYLFTRSMFDKRKQRLGKKPKMLPIDRTEAIDIDDEEDFLLAEYFMLKRLGH